MYDTLFEPINRGLRHVALRLYQPDEGMAVLDVGCGTGAHLELYSRYGCELFGIDPSASMLEIARRRLGDGAILHRGDASAMPYPDQFFDLVVCMLTLHEMAPAVRAAVLREAKRVLKTSGRVLLVDFHPGPLRPLKGWLTRILILVSELAAGREHFRNYRNFMKVGGLPGLITEHGLAVRRERIVSGGALGLFLLTVEAGSQRRSTNRSA